MDVDIDYLASPSWDQDMPERMRWLRENAPVYWAEKSGVWVLTKYEDVVAVSKNAKLFCSGQGVRPGLPVRQGLIDEDDPRHTELRKLINRGFTPRMVGKLEPVFRQICTETLDAIDGRNEWDFVDDLAVPVPLLLIAEMIGIRKEDRRDFHRWSDAMMAGDGAMDDPERMQAATQAFVEYSTYITDVIEDRRRNPQDDLVSILANAKDGGVLEAFDIREAGRGDASTMTAEEVDLANDELVMLLILLLVAGNETTRNALSGAMALLIEHDDARQALAGDSKLIPAAVDEMLRLVSPVHSFARTATADTEIRGQKIREGEKVLMMYPSANRDEEAFESADTLRIDRKPLHVAFGIGPHYCLGANLARMELRVALEETLARHPRLEFTRGGPEIRPSALVRSVVHMFVRDSEAAS